jgi:integrase
MPKLAKEMSALEVKRLEHDGGKFNKVFSVGGVQGLMLQITPTGSKSWLLRTPVGGKRRHIGLGSYPTVTLAQARERARAEVEKVWQGLDPVEERKKMRSRLQAEQKRGLTFEKAVEKFLESKLTEFRNPKHCDQWRSTLRTYANPELGRMLVGDIGVQDVLRVLEPIWQTKTETATRVRGRIEGVLAWATVTGHRVGDNPARWKGNLDAILPKPSKLAKVTNHPALSISDVVPWFADLKERDGMAARALELMTLTVARSGEIRGATWSEFDLVAGLWIIPAERMKAGKEHRVPLTAQAVALLETLPRDLGSPYVFPAVRGGILSDMTLSACMRRINEAREGGYLDKWSGRPAVPHGLRSTFRDWASENGVSYDQSERALAHKVRNAVEAAYHRTDLLEQRRGVMEAWAAHVTGSAAGGNVVTLTGRE